MKQYIDKSAAIAKIRSLQDSTVDEEGNFYTAKAQAEYNILCMLESFLDTLEVKEVEEEPVSKDLEEAAKKVGQKYFPDEYNVWARPNYEAKKAECAFMEGAQWQKEQTIYKACNYLFSHMGLFVTYFDDDIVENIERSDFIKKFRIAMEE